MAGTTYANAISGFVGLSKHPQNGEVADKGLLLFGVRKDSVGGLVYYNSDYAPLLVGKTGELKVIGHTPRSVSNDDTAITTATTTTLIGAPSDFHAIRVYFIMASNTSATITQVSWQEGTAGVRKYRKPLTQNASFERAFGNTPWDLPAGTALVLRTGQAGNIYWTVEYDYIKIAGA